MRPLSGTNTTVFKGFLRHQIHSTRKVVCDSNSMLMSSFVFIRIRLNSYYFYELKIRYVSIGATFLTVLIQMRAETSEVNGTQKSSQ